MTMEAGSFEDRIERARALEHEGDLGGARDLLVELTREDGSIGGLWHNLGRVLHNLGSYDEAVLSFDRAISLGYPSHSDRGLAHELAGRDDLAERDYEAALVLDADDVEALVNLGLLRLEQALFESAEVLLRRAARVDAAANWQLADVLSATGRVPEASAALDAAIEAGEMRAHLDRAMLSASEGDAGAAEHHFREAIEHRVARARREFAIYLDLRGEPEVALEVAREGIEEGDTLSYAPAAVIAESLGYKQMAIDFYRQAILAGDTEYEEDLAALLKGGPL